MDRCIVCHRDFGKEQNNAETKCTLNRFFSFQPGGALGMVLHELITECTGVNLDPSKSKSKYTCLMCAHAMVQIKVKRDQLLIAKEKLTDLIDKEGFVSSKMVSSGRPANQRASKGLKRKHPDDPELELAPSSPDNDKPKKKKKSCKCAETIKICLRQILSTLETAEQSDSDDEEAGQDLVVSTETPPQQLMEHLPDGPSYLSPAKVLSLSKTSSSVPNMALLIVRQVFTEEEMASSNCRGVKGKNKLDSSRLEFVRKAVSAYASVTPEAFDIFWKKQCVLAIDEGCRRLKRAKVKLNSS